MLGQITPIIVGTANAPSAYLSNLWNDITNQFVYGTGTQWNEFPTIPSPVAPPAPLSDTQTPGTSVYIDPTTGSTYTPSEMVSDWWSQLQGNLANAFSGVAEPDSDSWMLWVLGGALVLFVFTDIWNENVRHGR